jgi:hypothetical protein
MGRLADLDSLIIAAVMLLIIALGTLKSINGAFRKKEASKKPEPPKPTGVVKAAHDALDAKAEEEQGEIKDALESTDPGKGLAGLINRRRRGR